MGTRPECNVLVTALTKETAYGTATADGSLLSKFHLMEPAVSEPALETTDDNDLLKEHEFPEATAAYKILFTDHIFDLANIPASAEFLAWILARAFGLTTSSQIATSGDYNHVAKLLAVCTADQLPSSTIGVVWKGSTAVSRKYKGVVPDNLTIRLQDRGRLIVGTRLISDGDEADGSGIAVPATFKSANFLFGKDGLLEIGDAGGGLTDYSDIFRSFEFTLNNNLDVESAKRFTLNTDTVLPELRVGRRTIAVTLTLKADEEHVLYKTKAKTAVLQHLKLTVDGPALAGGNDADFILDIPRCMLKFRRKPFDGTLRTIEFEVVPFYSSADASPIITTVTTRDAAVL